MLQCEYDDSALKLGRKLGAEIGPNPYKCVISAASDHGRHRNVASPRVIAQFPGDPAAIRTDRYTAGLSRWPLGRSDDNTTGLVAQLARARP